MNSRIRTGMLVFAVAATAVLASCSSKITEEQLAELQRLRQQEQTLKQQISAKKSEKSRLQGEVDARQAEVDRCNTKKQFVQSKLAQWPNVWPDWSGEEPQSQEATKRR